MTATKLCLALFATLASVTILSSAKAAIVNGQNGVSLSIYANPFDPNGDFNPAETTRTFGDPTTGTAGPWSEFNNTGLTVSRVDGRTFYGGEAARLGKTGATSAPAYLQYQAPAPFTVGTIITAQSVNFNDFSSPMPYTLQLNNGNPGETTAAWAGVPVVSSGPGVVNTHPINVIAGDGSAANTVRVEFSASSNFVGAGNSQVAMNEVLVLPDALQQISAVVTSQSTGATNMQGAVDGNGVNTGTSGLWYDQSGTPIANQFFEMQINGGVATPISSMVLFSDGPPYSNQKFQIRKDGIGGDIIADVEFTQNGEIVPIRFLTPVTTDVLRFEWLVGGAADTGTLREVLLFADVPAPPVLPAPEPGSLALLAMGGLMLLKRRRQRA